jgi:hypothetical protein
MGRFQSGQGRGSARFSNSWRLGEIHSRFCANGFAVCYHGPQREADLLYFVGFAYCGLALKLHLTVLWWSAFSPGAQDRRR